MSVILRRIKLFDNQQVEIFFSKKHIPLHVAFIFIERKSNMPHESLTGISFKTIARKVAPILFLNLVVWFVAAVVKYPIILKTKVNWEQAYLDTFLFATLFTVIMEFKQIKAMIRLIRSGEL
jgi:hypothetical protein